MHTVTCTLSPSNPTPAGQFPPYITMHVYAPSKCIWHVVSEKQGSLCLNLAKGNVSPVTLTLHRKVRMGGRGPAPSPPTPHPRGCTCPPQTPPPRANSPSYITMHFYAPSKCIWHVVSENKVPYV